VVVASIVLGVGILVVGARSLGSSLNANRRNGVQSVAEPTTYDHWHEAFAVDVCGTTLPPLVDRGTDQNGIHTHGDGIIHVHPFTNDVAGANATFGVFANQVGMVLGSDQVRLPDGTTKKNGDDCNGAPGRWQLVEWDVDDPTAEPVVRYSGFESVRFTADRHAFTLAFLPSTTTPAQVPKPSSIPTLDQLSDAPSTTTRRPGTTSPRGTTAPSTTPPTTTKEQAAEAQAMLPLLIDQVEGHPNSQPGEVMSPTALETQNSAVYRTLLSNGLRGAVQRGYTADSGGSMRMVTVTIYKLPADLDAAKAKDQLIALSTTSPAAPARSDLPSLDATVFGPITPGTSHYWMIGRKGQYLVTVDQLDSGLVAVDTSTIAAQLARLP